jgi:hypothetical protein
LKNFRILWNVIYDFEVEIEFRLLEEYEYVKNSSDRQMLVTGKMVTKIPIEGSELSNERVTPNPYAGRRRTSA